MMTRTLALNQSAIGFSTSGDGLAGDPPTQKFDDVGTPTGNLHVSIVGTSASLTVFGRATPAMPWATLATVTTSGVTVINLLPEMYAQVTAISAAVVNAAVAYPIAGA